MGVTISSTAHARSRETAPRLSLSPLACTAMWTRCRYYLPVLACTLATPSAGGCTRSPRTAQHCSHQRFRYRTTLPKIWKNNYWERLNCVWCNLLEHSHWFLRREFEPEYVEKELRQISLIPSMLLVIPVCHHATALNLRVRDK